VKGEREDIPVIARNMANQVANLLQPAMDIAGGKGDAPQLAPQVVDEAVEATASNGRRRRNPKARPGATPTRELKVVADPQTWGKPLQTWNCADKAIWLVFVMAETGVAKELIGAEIARLFNANFREAKTIRPQNVNRDLSKLKVGSEAYVGRNENEAWFLTDLGKKYAADLVSKAQGIAAKVN
jgi:hypothetical protein